MLSNMRWARVIVPAYVTSAPHLLKHNRVVAARGPRARIHGHSWIRAAHHHAIALQLIHACTRGGCHAIMRSPHTRAPSGGGRFIVVAPGCCRRFRP